VRRLAPLLVAAALAAPATAAPNPEQVRLQRTLKADMAKTFKQRAPQLKITTVRCKLPASGTVAKCTAHFTYGTAVKGYYPVTATLHDLGGTLTWKTGAPKCRNAKTNRRVSCQPPPAGYIAPADAEALLKQGFDYRGTTVRAVSATCARGDGAAARNGAYSRLTCSVGAAGGHRYRVELVMVGPKSVSVARVTRSS